MKDIKIVMADNALQDIEDFCEDDKETQEFLDMLKKGFEDGSFIEDSQAVDMQALKIEEPEVYEALMEALESLDNKKLN